MGLASMAVLAACSASPGTPSPAASATPSTLSDDERQKALNTPTDLTFWTWVPEIAGEIALFQKAYPNIKVSGERRPATTTARCGRC
ncbi:MAG: hypothetical protein IPL43_00350 [Micropruina sp.]|nr:hypothetical protein [Micropruina sp.]